MICRKIGVMIRKYRKYIQKGFTLIELLVVIAIIGILSTVVLSSLSSAKNKGADAAVRSNLNNARAQADLYYSENGSSYSNVCSATSDDSPAGIASLVSAADISNRTGGVTCVDASHTGVVREWAMEAQLVRGTNLWFCTDYTGTADIFGSSTIQTAGPSDAVCG